MKPRERQEALELANRLAGEIFELRAELKQARAQNARMPTAIDWIRHALEERRLSLARDHTTHQRDAINNHFARAIQNAVKEVD
jgi:hypothetical protein